MGFASSENLTNLEGVRTELGVGDVDTDDAADQANLATGRAPRGDLVRRSVPP